LFSEVTGLEAELISIDQVLRLPDPREPVLVVLIDSMPENGDWQIALEARMYLDELGIPVVGSSVHTLSVARDKIKTREVMELHQVPIPLGGLVSERGICPQFPTVVKPRFGSASIGVQLLEYGDHWTPHDDSDRSGGWVWESYVGNAELTVSVVRSGRDLVALPAIEIGLEGVSPIYDFNTKVVNESNTLHQPPRIAADLVRSAEDLAVRACIAVEVDFVARVDVRVDSDSRDLFVIDINAEPTMHSDDFVARSASAAGLSLHSLYLSWLRDIENDRISVK